jgi:hypothetical protein
MYIQEKIEEDFYEIDEKIQCHAACGSTDGFFRWYAVC